MRSHLFTLPKPIWVLALGRLLSQIGTGFTLFYAPIYFVNQLHFSATSVGFGLGLASVTGIGGRILGGTAADSPQWGRKKVLLLSVFVAAIASGVLAMAQTFTLFVLGNLLMGFGVGTYWPATEAMVADITQPDQRNEAYALTRLGDSLGLGLGVVFGGLLISATGAYSLLFWLDGLSFLVFGLVLVAAVPETLNPNLQKPPVLKGWLSALQDRRLQVYMGLNILLTTYIAQTQTTLPLYFTNFVHATPERIGFEPTVISGLFTLFIVVSTVLQLPVARMTQKLTYPKALAVSAGFWGLGFLLTGWTGITTGLPLGWASLSLVIFAIATVTYTPSASALVASLAPETLRGIYLALNSLCWAMGYLIGPPLGGTAMDLSRPWADIFWVAMAGSVCVTLFGLRWLQQLLLKAER